MNCTMLGLKVKKVACRGGASQVMKKGRRFESTRKKIGSIWALCPKAKFL